MPGVHALLSPSSAHRWLHCTPAPRLEALEEEKSSSFADEGTLAHAICATKLKSWLKQDTSEEEREIAQHAKYHTSEMEEYTDTYVSIVLEKYTAALKKTKDAKLLIETRLDFTEYVPESFGTGDAVIIADGTMEVIDFKYGKGVRVEAKENPQMMIYALGAMSKFSFDYRIEDVKMTIVQPRIDNLSEYELHITDLWEWAEFILRPAAKRAFKGEGEQKPGEWCQFCKVKACCKALAREAVEASEWRPDPKLVTKEDMEALLPKLPVIKTWLAGVEEFALEQALAGTSFSGYKVVEGRSIRKIAEPAVVQAILNVEGYSDEAIMKPEELKGISDLEKVVGKKKFNELCGEYIVKPQGKPTLVPESDKRPAFNAAADDFKDI